MLVRIWLQIQN